MAEKTPQEYAKELMEMYAKSTLPQDTQENEITDSSGGIIVNTTTLKQLYPVNRALITVFTGSPDNKNIIETGYTDQSGKSPVFKLKTPPKDLSLSAAAPQLPYSLYNIEIVADGYVKRTYLNVPVFSGVVSVQGADLLPVSAAGNNPSPQIFDLSKGYEL